MTDAQQIRKLYRKQEKNFVRWTNDLMACAYLLWKKQLEVGPQQFPLWLIAYCPEIEPAMATEMIRQLHETEPGKRLVAELEGFTCNPQPPIE